MHMGHADRAISPKQSFAELARSAMLNGAQIFGKTPAGTDSDVNNKPGLCDVSYIGGISEYMSFYCENDLTKIRRSL